jgi:hypothetical protein
MTATLLPTPLYEHPDGWSISYGRNALIATDGRAADTEGMDG